MDGWDPMQEEFSNSGGRKGNNGPKNSSSTFALYIGNIPMHMNKLGVWQLFEKYGKVVEYFVSVAQKRGKQYQFGRVVYGSYREAETALREMNDTPPLKLKVSFWKSTEGATANAGNGPIPAGNTHETRVNRQGNVDHYNPGSKDSYHTAGLAADGKTDSDTMLNANNGSKLTIPCMMCSAPATEGCRLCWTAYCSRKCQKLHWQQHMPQCTQLAKKYANVGLLPDPPRELKSQEANKVTPDGRNAINAAASDCTQAKDTRNAPTSSPRSNASSASESEIYPWVKATFPQDARVKALISHINSPSSFYIQQCDHTKLCEVIAVMQEVEESGPPVCRRAEFKVGFVVAAEYSDGESKHWYRAKVEKVLPNSMAEILFLDFGNKETVNCNSLRDVPASLKDVPYQAIHCGLFGFSNSDEYPDELVQKFKSMSDDETWVVNVGQEKGKLLVRLESSSAAGGCINDVFRKDLENNLPFKLKSILEVRKDSSLLVMTMVLANENNTFWCLGHAELESDMMLLLEERKVVKPDKSHRKWKVSDFVFAMSRKYSVWYRAQIIDILQEGYRVHYVDYGNVEVVTELAPLEDRFKEIPCLAILCSPRVENISTGDIIDGTLMLKHGEAELAVRNKPGLKLRLRPFNHPDVIKSLRNSAAENPCKVSNTQVEGNLTASVNVQKPLNDAAIVKVGPKAVSEDYSLFISQLKDLEYDHLPELTHVDVISVESSKSMYVHALEEIRDDMIILQASLNAFLNANESSMLPVRSLRIGNLVCTKFKDDQMWYRVAVENIDGEVITVRYVDYGNVDNVSRDCIVAIPQQFLRYPKMAIHVAVAGAQDDMATLFLMKERIFNSKCHPIQMTVVDAHARPVLVHLFTGDGRRVTDPERSSSASSQDSRNTVVHCKFQNPFSEKKPSDEHAAVTRKRSPSQSSNVSSKSAEASTQTMSPNANLQKQLSPGNTVASRLKETTSAIPNSNCNVPKASDSPKTASESHLVPLPNKCSVPKTYNLENASTCTLPVGEELKLTVLDVRSPDIIYFWQPEKQAEALSAMDEEIHKYCSNMSEGPQFKPAFADMCLAKFSASKRWYRGAVMVFGLEESLIFFVDYGNMEHVRNCNMAPMIDRFMELPLQAIHCRIDGCYTDREWSNSILDKVIDANDMFLVKVVSFDEENYVYSIQIPSLTKQLKGINVLPPDY